MNDDVTIAADGLTFEYGRKQVIAGISLTLGLGTNTILGRNGAGKTTLIRLLTGAATPSSGTVLVGGQDLDLRSRGGRTPLRRIGWLPQQFGFPRHMRVAEYVAYAAWLKELPSARLDDRVATSLDLADLKDLAKVPLHALSGGQLRRVGLAAAVVADPDVLILDEPTAGLDPEQREQFHAMVRQFQREKVVVIATHLLEDVHALAERIVVIDEGSLCWTGSPGDLCRVGGTDAAGVDGIRDGFRSVLAARR